MYLVGIDTPNHNSDSATHSYLFQKSLSCLCAFNFTSKHTLQIQNAVILTLLFGGRNMHDMPKKVN